MIAPLRRATRIVALLLMVAQLGLIAHRVEHYLLPDRMDSGEEACAAFTPVDDGPALPAVVAPPVRVAYAVRFWIARERFAPARAAALGFSAQAPPA